MIHHDTSIISIGKRLKDMLLRLSSRAGLRVPGAGLRRPQQAHALTHGWPFAHLSAADHSATRKLLLACFCLIYLSSQAFLHAFPLLLRLFQWCSMDFLGRITEDLPLSRRLFARRMAWRAGWHAHGPPAACLEYIKGILLYSPNPFQMCTTKALRTSFKSKSFFPSLIMTPLKFTS